MKNIVNFVLEKLQINKDTTLEKTDPSDPSKWKEGDIITAVFHYSMTLVDFYEITKATGKSFRMRKLNQKITRGHGQEGYCQPIPGEYAKDKEEVLVRVNKWNRVKIKDYYCHKWNGGDEFFSHLD